MTTKTNKEQAAEALVRLGLDGLYNPHGMTGKACRCGTCFCCEAFELVKKENQKRGGRSNE